MTYETVWSGTLERQGLHPGLSRMLGNSTSALGMNLPEAVPEARGIREGQRRRHMRPELERKALGLLKRGYTTAQVCANLGATRWQITCLRERHGISWRKS